MVTHLRVLSKSHPVKTNMTGSVFFLKSLRPFPSDKISLSIRRVKKIARLSYYKNDFRCKSKSNHWNTLVRVPVLQLKVAMHEIRCEGLNHDNCMECQEAHISRFFNIEQSATSVCE